MPNLCSMAHYDAARVRPRSGLLWRRLRAALSGAFASVDRRPNRPVRAMPTIRSLSVGRANRDRRGGADRSSWTSNPASSSVRGQPPACQRSRRSPCRKSSCAQQISKPRVPGQGRGGPGNEASAELTAVGREPRPARQPQRGAPARARSGSGSSPPATLSPSAAAPTRLATSQAGEVLAVGQLDRALAQGTGPPEAGWGASCDARRGRLGRRSGQFRPSMQKFRRSAGRRKSPRRPKRVCAVGQSLDETGSRHSQ